MNCGSARSIATRWLSGERKQPVANMVQAARQHIEFCRETPCVQTQMRLDHRPPTNHQSHQTTLEGPP
jgi:hypothetical protein